MFSFCRDDDEIQSVDVCKNEGQEEQVPFQSWEEDSACCGEGVSVTLTTPGTETTRIASPATSIEEITPLWKKPRVVNKGKDKADSRSSNVWDDTSLVLMRAQEVLLLRNRGSSLEFPLTRLWVVISTYSSR